MKIRSDVLSKTLQGEEVLLDMRSGNYFGLNPEGTFIWNQLRSGVDVQSIAELLSEEFGIPAEDAQRDTRLFLSELKREELLD